MKKLYFFSAMLDYDSQKSRDRTSYAHNKGNWESCNDRYV